MHLDVLDLRNFYYRTGLGRAAQRAVRDQVVAMWPSAENETVVGFGFAAPLLRPYLGSARRVIALMPGQQGVMPWPAGMQNVSVLCEENLWPIGNGKADKLIFLHGLETSDTPGRLLDEAWRALAPGGKALFIVPNRAGLWSRRDRTPFGFGRPYSLTQLETQLERHRFRPERHVAALFQPPSSRRFWMRTGALWEKMGRKLSSHYAGGVLVVEATKDVYIRPPGTPERARERRLIPEAIPQPDARPV